MSIPLLHAHTQDGIIPDFGTFCGFQGYYLCLHFGLHLSLADQRGRAGGGSLAPDLCLFISNIYIPRGQNPRISNLPSCQNYSSLFAKHAMHLNKQERSLGQEEIVSSLPLPPFLLKEAWQNYTDVISLWLPSDTSQFTLLPSHPVLNGTSPPPDTWGGLWKWGKRERPSRFCKQPFQASSWKSQNGWESQR